MLALYQKANTLVRGSGRFVAVVAPGACVFVPHWVAASSPPMSSRNFPNLDHPQVNQDNDRHYTEISLISAPASSSRPVRQVAASRRAKKVVGSSEPVQGQRARRFQRSGREKVPPHHPGPRRNPRELPVHLGLLRRRPLELMELDEHDLVLRPRLP